MLRHPFTFVSSRATAPRFGAFCLLVAAIAFRAYGQPVAPTASATRSVALYANALDYPGRDVVGRVEAAIADAPDHGVVQLVSREPIQLTRPLAIRKPVTVRIIAPAVHLADEARIDILANSVTIIGSGRPSIRVGNGAGIRVGAEDVPVYDWQIANVFMSPSPGKLPLYGIRLENAREGRLEHVYLEQFSAPSAAALEIASKSWSNKIRNAFFVRSAYGIHIAGDQINAITIAASNISWNRYGVFVEGGAVQGLSLAEGTQLEGNSVGVRLGRGTIFGLTLADVYAECYDGGVLLLARGNGVSPLLVAQASVVGGSIYSKNAIPIQLDSSASKSDRVRATLVAVSVMTSELGFNSVASVTGANAFVSLVGVSVSDPTRQIRDGVLRASRTH